MLGRRLRRPDFGAKLNDVLGRFPGAAMGLCLCLVWATPNPNGSEHRVPFLKWLMMILPRENHVCV